MCTPAKVKAHGSFREARKKGEDTCDKLKKSSDLFIWFFLAVLGLLAAWAFL